MNGSTAIPIQMSLAAVKPVGGKFYCPDGHQPTCAKAFKRRGYTRVNEETHETQFGATADARQAIVCWLPGWPQQRFKGCDKRMFRDFDTVSVEIKERGVFELHVNPDAVTNLRANIEDRNLWDKALLARAMGPKPWLPFQVTDPAAEHCTERSLPP